MIRQVIVAAPENTGLRKSSLWRELFGIIRLYLRNFLIAVFCAAFILFVYAGVKTDNLESSGFIGVSSVLTILLIVGVLSWLVRRVPQEVRAARLARIEKELRELDLSIQKLRVERVKKRKYGKHFAVLLARFDVIPKLSGLIAAALVKRFVKAVLTQYKI